MDKPSLVFACLFIVLVGAYAELWCLNPTPTEHPLLATPALLVSAEPEAHGCAPFVDG